MKKPTLTLVGAGPGDAELITMKGVRALGAADVVLYDALANPALLDHMPATARRIFVGKRAGQHLFQQREINRLIVRYAREYGHVVRLKGGDPFVFGRGQEEILYARRHGLATHLVPGVSSALAVPAHHGIPLTHRGASQSFWVTTATNRNDAFAADVSLAAQSSATIVILMGMRKLDTIVACLSKYRGQDEPVAIIQHGTLPHEKVGIGCLKNIRSVVQEKGLAAPAVIVVGAVVREQYPVWKHQVAQYLG